MLEVKNLKIYFHTRNGITKAVDDVSFSLNAGETLAIVGESGSGKSVICHAIMDLLEKPPARIESGSITLGGENIFDCTKQRMRQLRGNDIGMIFQDPMTSLNPNLTIGEQLIEPLIYHSDPDKRIGRRDSRLRAIGLLSEVGIPDAKNRIDNFPHQFSGGMRQRVMIAMALIGEPRLLICDEPTTALDVTVQTQILELIKKLQAKQRVGIIFVSHDLGVVAGIADKVLVLCDGVAMESGKTEDIFYKTKSQYTRSLLEAIPSGGKPGKEFVATGTPLVETSNLSIIFNGGSGSGESDVKAVDDISLQIYPGEILGLVGESGSGKSTLGRSILRLIPPQKGKVIFEGNDLTNLSHSELIRFRRKMQMIFQDPYASLNPRMTIYQTLAEPMLHHGMAKQEDALEKVLQLMDEVGLEHRHIHKYPHEFSGGQRQRIAIGRAISIKPDFIVADEPVSALDVTIQSQILGLIMNLVERHKITMLFISHDLSVVRSVTDRVAVMKSGRVIEDGKTEQLWQIPQDAYTKELLKSIPIADPRSERRRLLMNRNKKKGSDF
ncbi:MAG: ABC transporter ATP-binding protein [Gammaproteobacteria bacterium]|nr:ABC transporter ATP-binding protein [Gammaproteobacteria bacterium]